MTKEATFEAQLSDPLLRELDMAKAFLHNWLNAESTHWKQRVKVKWLQEGDKNTKFFHILAKAKGIRNRIDKIKVEGTLFEDGNMIKDQASIYFSNLYQADTVIPDEDLFNLAGPSVTVEQNKFLVAVPAPKEIRKAVF